MLNNNNNDNSSKSSRMNKKVCNLNSLAEPFSFKKQFDIDYQNKELSTFFTII